MNNYSTILFDLDNTILNFDVSEDYAIKRTLKKFNIPLSIEVIDKFKEINKRLWKRFERMEVTKEEVLINRFYELIVYYDETLKGYDKDYLLNKSKEINTYYLNSLTLKTSLMENSIEVLEYLYKKCDLYIVTNGVFDTQMKRIQNANIGKYFKGYFVSEKIGHQKPKKEFFDYVFMTINNNSRVLLVGDSLSADIIGGINYGIDTVWYNPLGINQNEVSPTYEIKDLKQIMNIV